MAKTLTARSKVDLNWSYQNTDGFQVDANPPTEPGNTGRLQIVYAAGTSGEKVLDEMYRERREIFSATVNDDLDLAGSLANIWGDTITFANIRLLYVHNLSLIAGDDLLIGGATSGANAWEEWMNNNQDSEMRLRASGEFFLSAPLDGLGDIVAGSKDVLRIKYDGSSNSIEYEIALLGVKV